MRKLAIARQKATHILGNYDLFWYLIMFLAIGVGIYVRFKGIGKWPLADDEYYIAKSVKNILAYGIPKFECGGYYVRGILYQYMAAPFLYFFSNDEFYLRAIPAILNILAIVPLYWLGKRLSGVACGCVVVLFFSFSLWEIEFSRFARMYCPFQTIFLWYLFFLLKVIIDNDKESEKWIHFLSILSVFVYEASIFLLALNFVPLYFNPESMKKSNIFLKMLLFVLGYFFLSIDFRHLGVQFYLPSEIQAFHADKGGIVLPKILVLTLPTNFAWALFFLIPLSANTLLVNSLIRSSNLNLLSKISICGILLLSILNQFGLLIVLSIIMLSLGIIIWNKSTKKILKNCMLVILLSFLFWVAYSSTSSEWRQYFDLADVSSWKNTSLILFNYPDLARNIIRPWMLTMPILSVAAGSIIFCRLMESIKKPKTSDLEFRILFSITLILCLLVSAAPLRYHETRYTFFLYPVIILLVGDSMTRLAKFVSPNPLKFSLVLLTLMISFFSIVEDFSINHMKKIDSKEVNFRMNYKQRIARHFYPRRDYNSPALVINDEISSEDIVISTLTPVDFYIKRIDYIFIDKKSKRLPGVIACSGSKELWSNAKIIYSEEKLWNIVDDNASVIWLIAASKEKNKSIKRVVNISDEATTISEKIFQKYHSYIFQKSLDKRILVYKISHQNKIQ
jgi:hypothetical protein